MSNLNIPKILTLTTALIFNIFSINQFIKAYIGETPPENKSQFN